MLSKFVLWIKKHPIIFTIIIIIIIITSIYYVIFIIPIIIFVIVIIIGLYYNIYKKRRKESESFESSESYEGISDFLFDNKLILKQKKIYQRLRDAFNDDDDNVLPQLIKEMLASTKYSDNIRKLLKTLQSKIGK